MALDRVIITPRISAEAEALLGPEFMKWMENINGLLTNDNEGQTTGIAALANGIQDTGQITNTAQLPTSIVMQQSISTVLSGALLTVTDAGSDATVTIQNHTRSSAGQSVSITGGTITGLVYSTVYYIYYDDEAGTGGSVTYVATTVATDISASAARVSLGSITTVASGDPPLDLGGDAGSGGFIGGGWQIIPS